MKYLILIFFALKLIIPLELFSQTINQTIRVEESKNNVTWGGGINQGLTEQQKAAAASKEADAAALKANAARSAAMKEPSTEILIPLEVDLKNYTHIALVSVVLDGNSNNIVYNWVADDLMSSPLTVINPTVYRKLFNNNRLYLRDTKQTSWLYLYYTKSMMGVDEIRELLIRDSNNKVIYSSINRNIPFSQVMSPILNF